MIRRDFVRITCLLSSCSLPSSEKSVYGFGSTVESAPPIKSITVFKSSETFIGSSDRNSYDRLLRELTVTDHLSRSHLPTVQRVSVVVGYREPNEETLSKIKSLIGKDPFSFYDGRTIRLQV
jgi:hypothetical protein